MHARAPSVARCKCVRRVPSPPVFYVAMRGRVRSAVSLLFVSNVIGKRIDRMGPSAWTPCDRFSLACFIVEMPSKTPSSSSNESNSSGHHTGTTPPTSKGQVVRKTNPPKKGRRKAKLEMDKKKKDQKDQRQELAQSMKRRRYPTLTVIAF